MKDFNTHPINFVVGKIMHVFLNCYQCNSYKLSPKLIFNIDTNLSQNRLIKYFIKMCFLLGTSKTPSRKIKPQALTKVPPTIKIINKFIGTKKYQCL